ncbi:MAG: transglutaminase family protein [Burkholderiaceae bacterium]|nr:transglutaminase family protein [Burkholderiaceae bacterium]
MLLHITHETRYDYRPAVETAHHVLCLQPISTALQDTLERTIEIQPAPLQPSERQDVFGNHLCQFSLQPPHETLQVISRSRVRTRAPLAAVSTLSWEAVRDRLRYCQGMVYDPAVEFSLPSPHVPLHADFARYAHESFAAGRTLLEAARHLMQRIYQDFTYASQSTEVNTPVLTALAQRKGVCQDFAHILIACLRSLGLPGRYVSGYLLTQPPPGQPRLIGADASHAWAQVYLPDLDANHPGQGWYDLDPTNNRDGWGTPGEDYVTVARGRDYSDVAPMRGVIHGGAKHTLHVGVTVAPVDEEVPPEASAAAGA